MTTEYILSPPRQTQAIYTGCTFKLPPLDGSLMVPQIFDWHYENNPSHPVFVYYNMSSATGSVNLRYSDVVPAAHRAGRFVARQAQINLDAVSDSAKPVAIVAATDTITYFTTILGFLRAGIHIFLISPRNSVSALAHLLLKTQCSHIFVSADRPIRELVNRAFDEISNSSSRETCPLICSMPVFQDIFSGDVFEPLPVKDFDPSSTLAILHSSGSSSFPKPIHWTHRSLLQVAIAPHFGARDLCSQLFGCHSLAMFHAIGVNFIAWMAASGLVMATFPPSLPIMPTPDSIFQGFVDTNIDYAFGVPSFFETWATDFAKVSFFRDIKGVVYGGGPLSKLTGDYLNDEGVNIYTLYGLTEIGVVGNVFSFPLKRDWEYFTINPHCAAEFIPADGGAYELIAISKPTQALPLANMAFNGHDAYSSGDLFIPHPTEAGYWKIIGRVDDQIMLSTGEKTNPSPLEAILCQDPHIKSAVMFGRSRFHNGVIVEPDKLSTFDSNDNQKLADFRNAIWPTIEKMNAFAPSHSRLFKEMIIVADPSKPFTWTSKGTPRRAAILEDYSAEIEETYGSIEQTVQVDVPLPVDWSFQNVLPFVRAVVKCVLTRASHDEDDIFECGCNSLQATWIGNSILHPLRTSGTLKSRVPTHFVYDHPTIFSLAQYVFQICRQGSMLSTAGETISNAQALQVFLDRYTLPFPAHCHVPGFGSPQKEAVFVTGTTGSLGAAVLAHLDALDSVARIYCFNRQSPNGPSVLTRQQEALGNRGYNEAIAESPKVVLLEGDLTHSSFGLPPILVEEIRRCITHIIHIAWHVDFNMSLPSFSGMVGGVRALIELALSSPLPEPPRIIFTSSIGVLRNQKSNFPIAELPIDNPAIPAGQGYGESKWASEQILYTAAAQTPLRPIVVRVGQISGGKNGAWNTSDWVPALVKSSLVLGCLPYLRGVCSWVPLDLAAQALVENRNGTNLTVHLVHPRPIQASELLQVMSNELSLPLRPFKEWFHLLENTQPSGTPMDNIGRIAVKIPAVKLVEFFRGAANADEQLNGKQTSRTKEQDREVMGLPILANSEAMRASKALRDVDTQLGSDDVRAWLTYWRSIGYIPLQK